MFTINQMLGIFYNFILVIAQTGNIRHVIKHRAYTGLNNNVHKLIEASFRNGFHKPIKLIDFESTRWLHCCLRLI